MKGRLTVPLTLVHKRADGTEVTYKRHEELGRGGFAAVYRVTDLSNGESFALKAISRERVAKPKSAEKLKSEISIQSSLDHPNVVKSFAHFEDYNNYYIILELCPGHSVRDRLKKEKCLTESETQSILRQILAGLCYLHDNRIIHRDLKLENFLFGNDDRCKIADFGLSAQLDYDDERKYTVCGTPNYLSPELLLAAKKGHSYEVDIWTIGVCAFAMLTGHPPFETAHTKLTYEHIKKCQ
jgi:polo-like kinase 1